MTVPTRAGKPSAEFASMAIAAGAATLVAIVMLGSFKPVLLIAAPIGAVALIATARRPAMTLVVMVVAEVTDVSGVLAPRTGLPLFQVSVLLGLLAVGFALRDQRNRQRLNAWTGICVGVLVFFLMTQAVATIGSSDMSASLGNLYRVAVDFLFVVLVLMLVQLTARPWMVAAAIVIPFAALSLLTLVNQVVFAGTASFGGFSTLTTGGGEDITTLRFGGPLPDPNFWGRHLIMGLPLAAALLTRALRAHRRPVAAGWAVAILSLLIGIYLTQSRGTFLAGGVGMVVWFIASGPTFRKRGVAILPLSLGLLVVPGIGNRLLATVGDVLSAQTKGHVDPSVLGRIAAQQQAALMWQERPFFGFGPGTFFGEVINFGGRVPMAVREPPPAPHNIYLQFAAESGSLGVLGWAVVILGFLAMLTLAILARPHSQDRVLVAAVLAAIAGWSVASIFLHLTYIRSFGVVLALAAGLAPAWPVATEAVHTLLRGIGRFLVASAVGIGAAVACLMISSSPSAVATQRMTLIPVGPSDGYYSYALDIRSRIEFLPTFAKLLRDPNLNVDIVADPVRGLLDFTAKEDTPMAAREQLQLAASYADKVLHESIGYLEYSLEPVASMQIDSGRRHTRSSKLVAAGFGLGAAAIATLVLFRRAARRRIERSVTAIPQLQDAL